MLFAENLTCRRGGRSALQSLDLHVAPREIVALVGPEHAGKTTALECFLGLHRPLAGRVAIDGLPAPAAASLVAYVPTLLSFPADARVLSYVRNSCLRLGRRIPDPVLCATLERNGVSALCAGAILRLLAAAPLKRHAADDGKFGARLPCVPERDGCGFVAHRLNGLPDVVLAVDVAFEVQRALQRVARQRSETEISP